MKGTLQKWRVKLIKPELQDDSGTNDGNKQNKANSAVLTKSTFGLSLTYQFATVFVADFVINVRASSMKGLFQLLTLLLGTWLLAGCASTDVPRTARGLHYLPGNAQFYSLGTGQSVENFANISKAQWSYGLYRTDRHWTHITPGGRAGATDIVIRAYYPMNFRWKLKDGREYMLESVNVAAIMQDYFKTHDIQLQWQKEGRPEHPIGDFDPMLAVEFKDDEARLKWVITTNLTPVDKRILPSKAATKWEFSDEEFLVIAIKGQPTSGINFDKRFETLK
jgi:hypothetical protein